MRRLLPLALVCAVATAAHADGFYYTEGVGFSNVKDELGAYYPDGSMRIRIGLGQRRGDWAIEGYIAPEIDVVVKPDATPLPPAPGARDPGSAGKPDLLTFGLDLKRMFPLSRHVELYLRGSASYGMARGVLDDWSGRGLGFGAGIQLKGKGSVLGLLWWPLFFFVHKGPQMTGALWVDDGYEFYRLHDGGPAPRAHTAIDGQLTHITFGFAVGSDF